MSVKQVSLRGRPYWGAHEVKATKGARPRSVRLSTDPAAALRRARGEAGDDDLVFPDEAGDYHRPDHFRRVLVRTAKGLGIRKHVHLHMLRHTFAMMRGVPVQVIQKWLGHANITTTERYAHLRPDTGDDLIELLVRCHQGATSERARAVRSFGQYPSSGPMLAKIGFCFEVEDRVVEQAPQRLCAVGG